MKTYNRNVSDVEFKKSPRPTKEEIAEMSQSLGALIYVDVPVLECLSIVIEITPNACLRKILDNIFEEVRCGGFILPGLRAYSEILDENFITIVSRGEVKGNLADMLFQYAKDSGLKPGHISDKIGRSDSLKLFTQNMVTNLKKGKSVLKSLSLSTSGTTGTFQKEIKKVRDDIEYGYFLCEAMARRHATFDRMYCNVIKAGEVRSNLLKSFQMLVL